LSANGPWECAIQRAPKPQSLKSHHRSIERRAMKSSLSSCAVAAALAAAIALPPVLCAQGSGAASSSSSSSNGISSSNSGQLPDAPAQQRPSPFGAARPAQAGKSAPRMVTVLEDTNLDLEVITTVNSYKVKDGDPVLFMVNEDVIVDGMLAIPRGATVHGTVLRYRRSGTLTGSPDLTLALNSLDLGGRSYRLYSHQLRVKGLSKTRPTERKIVTGAAVGTVVGSIGVSSKSGVVVSSNPGVALAGAAVGAGVGTAVAALSPSPEIIIPSESEIEFTLAAPVAIFPVSAAEAERLGKGLTPGGPILYVRGENP